MTRRLLAVPVGVLALALTAPGCGGSSGSDQQLAFTRARERTTPEIYVVNDDGGGLDRLTLDPSDDIGPAWSPDGERLVFARKRHENFDLWTMSADGTGITPLAEHPGDDGFPSWSPDGNRIAFASDRDGNFEIYVMAADGRNAER